MPKARVMIVAAIMTATGCAPWPFVSSSRPGSIDVVCARPPVEEGQARRLAKSITRLNALLEREQALQRRALNVLKRLDQSAASAIDRTVLEDVFLQRCSELKLDEGVALDSIETSVKEVEAVVEKVLTPIPSPSPESSAE